MGSTPLDFPVDFAVVEKLDDLEADAVVGLVALDDLLEAGYWALAVDALDIRCVGWAVE